MERKITVLTPETNLNISIEDLGSLRKIQIDGPHVVPNGDYRSSYSEMETKLSLQTLTKIAKAKGKHFRDEIERSENPDYMYKEIKDICESFNIDLCKRKILDFGCGSGAFALNLLRLGSENIIGAEVDPILLDIAQSRVDDFYKDKFLPTQIGYVNKENNLPFPDESFDIVWAHAVLEHVFPPDRKYVLGELSRVLRKNGLLILDATPNRLWIKEWHTTGLYLLNYLPLNLACFLARKFSPKVPPKQSAQILLSRGLRGCTYWGIAKYLPSMVCINNLNRRKDLEVFMRNWFHEGDTWIAINIKKTYGYFMSFIDPMFKIMRFPQTAFLPSHIIVFKKQAVVKDKQ